MAQLVARLVRNEKVGGSNPPSSTTGRHPIRMSVFCMPGRVGVVPGVVLLVAPLVFRALRVLCWAGLLSVPMGGGPPASRPRSELRSARRLEARPGPAASHGQRSLALHTGGIWRADGVRTRPGPAAAHRHGARVSAWTVTVAFNGARANLVCDFRQVLFIAILRRSSPVEWCNRFVSFGVGYALSWSGGSSCPVGWGVSRDLVRMSRLR